MLLLYFAPILVFKLIEGAKIPPPPGASTPVFQDECKDPALNDCPFTSICVDYFYGYTCQCRPGFVDQSPNIQEAPGRVCVQVDGAAGTDGALSAKPQSSAAVQLSTASAVLEELATQATKKPHRGKVTDKTEPTKDEVTKSPLNEIVRDVAASDTSTTRKPKSHRRKGHAKNSTKGPESEKTTEAPTDSASENAVRDAFDYFDTSKDGQINFVELKTATRNLGQKLTNEDLKQMLAVADRNGDGVVSFDEFSKFMRASRRNKAAA